MIDRRRLELYAITDRSWIQTSNDYHKNIQAVARQVEQALKGGVTMIQMREKNLSSEEMIEEAIVLKELCHKYQVPFLINDYVELAKEVGADGVHVGQSDKSVTEARNLLGKDAIIGATAKTVEQALVAQKQGADYLGSGAVFGSTTKSDAKSMSHELLEEITNAVHIPVVAIGGINEANVMQLSGSGIAGVAVIGGIFGQQDICKASQELVKKLHGMEIKHENSIDNSRK